MVDVMCILFENGVPCGMSGCTFYGYEIFGWHAEHFWPVIVVCLHYEVGCGVVDGVKWLCLVLRLGCLLDFVFSAEFWSDFFLFLLCGSLSCLSIASSIRAVKMLCEFCWGGVDDIDHN